MGCECGRDERKTIARGIKARAKRNGEEGAANNLLSNSKLQPITLNLALDVLHVLHQEMSTAVLDLAALVGGAESDDGCARGDTSTDSRGRIFEDDTLLGVETELFGGEEEGVREGLAVLETLVVGGDGDGRGSDTDASHASVSCSK